MEHARKDRALHFEFADSGALEGGGGSALRPAFLAMKGLSKGLALNATEVQDAFGATQGAAPTAERKTGKSGAPEKMRNDAKVVFSHEIQVLADGVHVIAAGSKC